MKLFSVLCILVAVLAVSSGAPPGDPNPGDGPGSETRTVETGTNNQNAGEQEGATPEDPNEPKIDPPTTTKEGEEPTENTSPPKQPPPSHESSTKQNEKPEQPTLSVRELARKLSPLFNSLEYDQLKMLDEVKNDPESFEGLLQEFLIEKSVDGDAIGLLDQVKGRFNIAGGMLRGAMYRKKPKEKPVVPNVPAEKVNWKISEEKTLVIEELKKELKDVPPVDLGRIHAVLNTGEAVDEEALKKELGELKSTTKSAPALKQQLVDYAVSHPNELKYTIEQILPVDPKTENQGDTVQETDQQGDTDQTTEKQVDQKTDKQGDTNKESEGNNTPEVDGGQGPEKTESEQENGGATNHALEDGDDNEDGIENLITDFGEAGLDGAQEGDDSGPGDDSDNNDGGGVEDNANPVVPQPPHAEKPKEKQQETFETNGELGQNPGGGNAVFKSSSGSWFGMWHFLIIFLLIAGIVGMCYVCSHNRKRIREGVGAYISDAASRGKRARNYRYKPVSST